MSRSSLSLVLLATGLLEGCAATIPTELADARRTYAEVASGPAATLVPAELHKAHEALEQAEAAFKEDPESFTTLDLAYVAQRKAELAEALAGTAAEARSTADANAEYQATQDAILEDTRAELAGTQLAATRTAAELTASEAARALAEKQAAEAMAALAKLAAVKDEARGLVITLSGSVLFRSDEAALLPEAQTRLGQVADALMVEKDRKILVEGHTDSQGADAYNVDLSQRRAEAVRSFLVSRGYDPAKVRAAGIGEGRPVGDNASAEGRANNRRVEIVVEPLSSAAN